MCFRFVVSIFDMWSHPCACITHCTIHYSIHCTIHCTPLYYPLYYQIVQRPVVCWLWYSLSTDSVWKVMPHTPEEFHLRFEGNIVK
jgi:hypothetical protein